MFFAIRGVQGPWARSKPNQLDPNPSTLFCFLFLMKQDLLFSSYNRVTRGTNQPQHAFALISFFFFHTKRAVSPNMHLFLIVFCINIAPESWFSTIRIIIRQVSSESLAPSYSLSKWTTFTGRLSTLASPGDSTWLSLVLLFSSWTVWAWPLLAASPAAQWPWSAAAAVSTSGTVTYRNPERKRNCQTYGSLLSSPLAHLFLF